MKLKKIWGGALASLSVAAVVTVSIMVLKNILSPLSPAITILFVLFFTFVACGHSRVSTALAIGGIIVYAASWFTVGTCGAFVASFICCVGIVLWFSAAIRATVYNIRLTETFRA